MTKTNTEIDIVTKNIICNINNLNQFQYIIIQECILHNLFENAMMKIVFYDAMNKSKKTLYASIENDDVYITTLNEYSYKTKNNDICYKYILKNENDSDLNIINNMILYLNHYDNSETYYIMRKYLINFFDYYINIAI